MSVSSGLPPHTTSWILGSGRAGHQSHCLGVARELGLEPIIRPVRSRGVFASLAPHAPIDPRDAPTKTNSPLAPPFPDICFASGRATVPYLRALKRAAGARTFAVFLEDPRVGPGFADFIWVPEHDPLRGDNVFVTRTTPHPLRPTMLEAARSNPDPRVALLSSPRAALLIGGDTATHRFSDVDNRAIVAIIEALFAQCFSVAATPSRRTSPETCAVLERVFAGRDQSFFWRGDGANPYASMIANADAIVVTGDSVNMVCEALTTRAPVYVHTPAKIPAKIRRFLDGLFAAGVARPWAGAIEGWAHEPQDATADIANAIAKKYRAFRGL